MESRRALLVTVELLKVVVGYLESRISAFVDDKQNLETLRLINRQNAQG